MSESRIYPIRSTIRSLSESANDIVTVPDVTDGSRSRFLVWTNNKFVRCEDEPIHIPGKIQSFGALLAISKDTWDIRMASENCLDILGIDVRLLLAASSLKEFLDPDQIELLQDNISRMPADPLESGPDIMNLRFKNNSQVFCIYHCSSQNPGLIILEFEDPNDSKYPCNINPSKNPRNSKNSNNMEVDAIITVFFTFYNSS